MEQIVINNQANKVPCHVNPGVELLMRMNKYEVDAKEEIG